MFNLPHVRNALEMIARLLAVAAAVSLTLAPGLPVNAEKTTLIRICSAKGVRFVPFVNGDKDEPQQPHRGACHAACLGDRPKIQMRKPAA